MCFHAPRRRQPDKAYEELRAKLAQVPMEHRNLVVDALNAFACDLAEKDKHRFLGLLDAVDIIERAGDVEYKR